MIGWCARKALSLVGILCLLATTGHASEGTYILKLAPTSAEQAIKYVARKTGKSVLFPSGIVAPVRTKRLAGAYTVKEALDTLFEGTSLIAGLTEGGVITVSPLPNDEETKGEEPMNTKTIKSSLLAGASLAAALTTPAVAQEEKGFVLDTIVVTARRVQENLQNTPIAVTALTGRALEVRQIDTSDQLGRVTPNFQFSPQSPASGNNASSQIFVRGIGQTDFLPSTDPGVGVYLDGVYHARSVGANVDFLDLERIEILRGPQGTLFGRNTIGGAINITSQRPTGEFGGKVSVRTGSYDRVQIRGVVDTPITDTLSGKLAFGSHDRKGYVTRLIDGTDVGDDNSVSLRGQLLWEPSSSFTANLILDYADEDENGPPIVFNRINPAAVFATQASAAAGCPAPGTELNDPRCANNNFAAGPYANNGDLPLRSEYQAFGANLTMEWDLEWAELTSITGYRTNEWTGARDADNTPLTVLHTIAGDDQEQFSQELQLSGSSFEGKFDWLLGLYYFEDRDNYTQSVDIPGGSFTQDGAYESNTLAAFSNLTWNATDRLHITAGLRVFDENKSVLPHQVTTTNYRVPAVFVCNPATSPVGNVNSPLYDPGCAGGAPVIVLPANTPLLPIETAKRSFSDVTPVLSLSYDLGEETLIYANYSEGFKGGGFNGRQIFPLNAVPEFDEETASSYEIGFKTTTMDKRLRFNAAAFYTDYQDIQIVVRQNFAPININGGAATIKGFEMEMEFVPTPAFLFQAAVGYTHAEYDELSAIAISNGVQLDNDLQFSPTLTANAGASYALDLPGGATLTPRLDWSYQSETYFDAINTEATKEDGYHLLNASLRYESSNEAWSAIFAVTNLTDELYRTSGFSSFGESAAYEEAVFGRPREWSFTLEYKF